MISHDPTRRRARGPPRSSGRGTRSSAARSTAMFGAMRSNARPQLVGEPACLRLLPRERGRGVEHLDAAQVVVARAPHELVDDVDAVDAAREDRPAERGPEVEDVVGLVAAVPRVPDAIGRRERRGHRVRRGARAPAWTREEARTRAVAAAAVAVAGGGGVAGTSGGCRAEERRSRRECMHAAPCRARRCCRAGGRR